MLLLLVVLQLCTAVVNKPARIYEIDLNSPASTHFQSIAHDHAADMKKTLPIITKEIPQKYLALVENIAFALDRVLPAPYADEMRGAAAASGMKLGDIVLLNLAYDLTAFCTSIVAEAPDGIMLHARNLDYGLASVLRNLTVQVDFKSGGELQYRGSTYAGYVGLLTGMRPHAFTVSVDERDKGKWWMNAFEALLNHEALPIGFLVRDQLATAGVTFQAAVTALQDTPLLAPVYFIVAGVGKSEGAIITRDRLTALDTWRLGTAPQSWWRLETNYDHWLAPGDKRRDTANAGMQALGQSSLSLSGMFDVLSVPPVLNSGTTYTTLMAASLPGNYTTIVRYV